MADEVKRLNEILAESNQSFYKLYQALMDKKKQLAAAEAKLLETLKECDAKVLQLQDTAARLSNEVKVTKVG